MPPKGSQPPISDRGYLIRLGLCLSALLLLRLAGLYVNATDLVVDEAQYWSWSRELEHIQRFSILRGIPKSGEQCESSVLLGMEGDYGAGLQPGFA